MGMRVALLRLGHTRLLAWGLVRGEDDGDGVVEHGLAEDEHVEHGVDVHGLEDGQRRHRVHGRDHGAEGETGHRVQLVDQVRLPQNVDPAPHNEGRDRSAHTGEDQDGAQVGEEITLRTHHSLQRLWMGRKLQPCVNKFKLRIS